MAGTRVFISFDYDNDAFLKEALVGQSRNTDSPFTIVDWSIKVASPGWKTEARQRIRASDVVAVICGQYTHTAVGVAEEVKIAQAEGISYFLLNGYSDKIGTKPKTALPSDQIYRWTWDNLKALIGGSR
ncbi:TIR domain-containing protein [Actinomadura nitritigenes]|uniref:TIR domain-containing protein n=1 Tax=Actinomadura nitritigenes TaxID=134602 RepID=UPI003D93F0F7